MKWEEIIKLLSMRKSFQILRERQRELIKKFPDIRKYNQRLREVREKSIGNPELLNKTINNLEENGFNVFLAEDDVEARKIIEELLKEERIVVKSKSNVIRELDLERNLSNVEFVETDVGDRIIQLLKEKPSHPTGPASHLSAGFIAQALSAIYEIDISPNPSEIIKTVKKDIEEKSKLSKIGLSGTNAVTGEGSIVLLHNEGNIFEVISRPEKWIVVTGIDKLYPTIEDAIVSAKVQSYYAAGILIPSFIEIVSGVAKTTDIEKKLVFEVGRPKEIDVVLVDNGRSSLINSEFREILYCIGCGSCVVNCPAHLIHGDRFEGGRYALMSVIRGDRRKLKYCLSCGRCRENCPLGLNIPEIIDKLSNSKLKKLVVSHLLWLYKSIEFQICSLLVKMNLLNPQQKL